jgi:hypothetical protein
MREMTVDFLQYTLNGKNDRQMRLMALHGDFRGLRFVIQLRPARPDWPFAFAKFIQKIDFSRRGMRNNPPNLRLLV